MLRGGTWGLIGAAIQHLVEAAFRLSRTSTNNGTFKESKRSSVGHREQEQKKTNIATMGKFILKKMYSIM